jgi:hypothetical protein
MFKLCNYACHGKSCDFLGLFHIILLFMKIFLLVNFYRPIRDVYVYFVARASFSCL